MPKPGGYEQIKENARQRNAALSVAGRDIAPIPKIAKPKRRSACRLDFKRFCETYYPAVFTLAWSEDHLRVIGIIQNAVLHGGLSAQAMPRGSGKTSLCICAAEWALLYGHRSFVVLIGATGEAATDLLDHIVTDFESNDLLLADFPEVCYPIRRLEGITKRTAGQLCDGQRTQITWTQSELILPTVKKSKASGACVKVAGITGRVRGMQIARPADGATIRPDFVMIDDPQTDESAHSPQQNRRRLNIICGAVLGLAGPKKKIAGVMPCTVIAKGDVADEVLDRKKHPEWQGERIRMMRSLPTNTKLWERYAEVRSQSLRDGKGLSEATAFYLANRAELDAGADASWEARYNADEASAIQHAMNLKLTNEEAFAAEYQNEPLRLEVETPLLITPDIVASKATAVGRCVAPAEAVKVTAFIDVQGTILYYGVTAWDEQFGGHVLDYGTYPEQPRSFFFLREVQTTIQHATPNASLEVQIYNALDRLTTKLLGRTYETPIQGRQLAISRLLIDSGYKGDVVKQFCAESAYKAILLPSKGYGITADRQPLNDWAKKPGMRTGWNWRVSPAPDNHILYDANSWKTFLAQRIISPKGEPGTLSLFEGTPAQHRMFSEHVASEYPTPTEGYGRIVNVWRMRPNRENHYLDCLMGTAVAASEQGITALGHTPAPLPQRPRRKVKANF